MFENDFLYDVRPRDQVKNSRIDLEHVKCVKVLVVMKVHVGVNVGVKM